jgi:hypothetical protein
MNIKEKGVVDVPACHLSKMGFIPTIEKMQQKYNVFNIDDYDVNTFLYSNSFYFDYYTDIHCIICIHIERITLSKKNLFKILVLPNMIWHLNIEQSHVKGPNCQQNQI